MDSDLDRLAKAMDQFAAFLRDVGETRWSDWVSSDAERVRSGDYGGVDHFLSAFGGMGSINDLAFMGSASDDREAKWRSRDEVAEPAYELAKEIQRRRPRADSG
jgi:hypothetical protein